jgi:hypothetical protein
MKYKNWEAVEESTPFAKLPAGGYVVRIQAVEDVAAREYLNIVYDIAEGDRAGFYSDDFGRKNAWAHRFVRSYKDKAEGMFRAFLARLEESNPGFSVSLWQQRCDERGLVGLVLGIVLQTERYTNESGEDKERLEVVGVYSADQIRRGEFRLPEPKDNRRAPVEAPAGEVPPASAYGDFPFDPFGA